jgi:hypothetical protein
MQAEHSTFRCAAYHVAESGITTTIPINNYPSFGVTVRWPGKKAEHSFFLDFFVTFFVKKKSKVTKSGLWKNVLLLQALRHLVPRCDKTLSL